MMLSLCQNISEKKVGFARALAGTGTLQWYMQYIVLALSGVGASR